MVSAFQQNGFQLNAFQIAFEIEWAFQKCAFQYGAFQVEQCDAEWVFYPAPRGPGVVSRAALSMMALRQETHVSRIAMAAVTATGRHVARGMAPRIHLPSALSAEAPLNQVHREEPPLDWSRHTEPEERVRHVEQTLGTRGLTWRRTRT